MTETLIVLGMGLYGILGYFSSKAVIHLLDIVDKTIIEHGVDRQAGRTMSVIAGFLSALTFLSHLNLVTGLMGCLFWASLSAAAYSDGLTKEIFDWVYLPSLIACTVMMVMYRPDKGSLIDLGIFLALQVLVFRHFYGGSDCIAFSACALFLTPFGCTLLEYALVMLFTMVLFTLWQGLGKNIHTSKDSMGNRTFLKLKQPDAMIPYIFLSMFIIMIYMTIPFVYAAICIAVICLAVYLLM